MAFIPLKVIRRDSDAVLGADGESQTLTQNSVGRLKVSQWPGAFNATSGSIVAATTIIGPVDISRAGAATVSVSGTFTGVNFVFEVSNDAGLTYIAMPAQRIDTGGFVTSTGVIATSNLAWDVTPFIGVGLFRVRATAWVSGSAVITIVPGAVAVENIVQVAPSTNAIGTVVSNQGSLLIPTTVFVNSAATTNATVIKASGGTLYSLNINNINAAARFVKIYNLAVAPTVGTSVPSITIPVPPSSATSFTFGAIGVRFGTGISLAITGLATDADATVVAASEIKVIASII